MPEAEINPGLILRAMTANLSPAASIARATEIAANPGSYEIPNKPKTLADQLDLPCCVSCALSAAMEILAADSPPLSPMFHYHVTRFDRFGADSTGSLYLSDSLNTVTNDGICRGDLHNQPFSDQGAGVKPTPLAYHDGKTRALGVRGLELRYIKAPGSSSRVSWGREQLRLNRPLTIMFRLPSTYRDDFLDSDFSWTDPNQFSSTSTGHCVLAFGYDDARRSLHIQDSYGPSRFDRGRWWMGYRVIDSPVVQDVYCLLP